MSKIIAFVGFTASESFVKDRAQFNEALAKIATVDGHVSSFWGLQVSEEGAKMGYIIAVWESTEHYKRFTTSEIFNQTFAILKTAAASEITRYQFTAVTGTPLPALQAEITELAVVKPKAGVSASAVTEATNRVTNTFNAHGHPAALGQSVNGDEVYLIVVGWPSVTESLANVKGEPFASLLVDFLSVADLERTHAVLDKHN
ncbi:hypothetical protein BT96DRAFT_992465 [Gymnopus androsaceus JB14]|uniref:ABM domain-containing protein n=1 Tax=Gymnopus androsaceus JB14 TaxID=1447944 RepID=A0A6A4HSK1_9AGAR|nr:hypothetical protein BT96DRAFT_992465 [Gymnopus androsaceus JB14]